MGSCISCLLKRRSDVEDQRNVQDDTAIEDIEVVDVQNERGIDSDLRVYNVVEDEAGIVDGAVLDLTAGSGSHTPMSSFCLRCPGTSCSPSPDSISFLVMKKSQRDTLYDSSPFWIYARTFDNHMVQSFHALDIQHRIDCHNYAPLAAFPTGRIAQLATTVLDKKLFVIGGGMGRFLYGDVFFCDPAMNKWRRVESTILPRRGAVSSTVGRRIYVFGGCSDQTAHPWGEVYNPNTGNWTAIPHSPTLIDALQIGLHPLQSSTVLGNKIFIRSSANGIGFDVTTSSWCPFPPNLFNHWWDGASTAAVVQNMLITCHRQYNEDRGALELCIRAYDPEHDVWLKLQGLDSHFHQDAYRSNFMAVNGFLVIYHMWETDHLRFSIIEIKEKHETRLVVKLLWRCWLPRFAHQQVLATPAYSWST